MIIPVGERGLHPLGKRDPAFLPFLQTKSRAQKLHGFAFSTSPRRRKLTRTTAQQIWHLARDSPSAHLCFLNFCGRHHTSTCTCQMARRQTPHDRKLKTTEMITIYFCSGRCNLILVVKSISIYLIFFELKKILLQINNILSNVFF